MAKSVKSVLLQGLKERVKFFSQPSRDMASLRGMLDIFDREMMNMGLPEKERKELITDLLKDIQMDVDKDMKKVFDDVFGQSAPLSKNLDVSHDFPLYLGQSKNGQAQVMLNNAYRGYCDANPSDVDLEFLHKVVDAKDAWLGIHCGEPFRLELPREHGQVGALREFHCELKDIMVRTIGEIEEGTPLRMRVLIRTVIPDNVEYIRRAGYFFLTGYLDVEDKNNAVDFVVRGLGFQYVMPTPAAITHFGQTRILMGSES